jgi:phage-related protein
MPIPTFTWIPDGTPTGTNTFRVLTAQFNDGYKQTAGDGLNNKSASWPLTFSGTKERIAAIKGFFDALGGSRPFYWAAPFDGQIAVRVDSYTVAPKGGTVYVLSATFEQAFKP